MTTFETDDGRRIPAVTADQMRRVDRIAVEEIDLGLLQMMENAGRNLAATVREMRGDDDPIVVLAGSGGNGGGGLCCARHLANHGVAVEVVLDRDPTDLAGAAARQFAILDAMDVSIASDATAVVERAALVVDALVGYGLQDAPCGRVADLIETFTNDASQVLALDVPSGVDATTGETPGIAITPNRTLTLALPKKGLAEVAGDMLLADISIPTTVYDRVGIDYESPFDRRYRVPVRPTA